MTDFKFFKGYVGDIIRWRTHRGDVICIHDMTTEHIENVITCYLGQGEITIPNPYEGRRTMEWLTIFRDELNRRNEIIS
jgi:hypothetical protein